MDSACWFPQTGLLGLQLRLHWIHRLTDKIDILKILSLQAIQLTQCLRVIPFRNVIFNVEAEQKITITFYTKLVKN